MVHLGASNGPAGQEAPAGRVRCHPGGEGPDDHSAPNPGRFSWAHTLEISLMSAYVLQVVVFLHISQPPNGTKTKS